jgi:DNA-binding Lrp family transcriptional regulator
MALSKIVGILSDNHGAIFGNKIVAQLTQFVYYGRKYLYPSRKLPAFTYSADVKRRKVSDSERSILSSIQRNEDASFRQLATLSNTSLSTVARALEQLEHDGVLVSYTRRINVASLGVQSYKLVVHAADLGDSFFRRIEEFCAQHLSVVSLARCVGPWDFDIRIELSATENPAMVVQEFQEAFDDGILSCMLSPLYQPIVMNNFPYTA